MALPPAPLLPEEGLGTRVAMKSTCSDRSGETGFHKGLDSFAHEPAVEKEHDFPFPGCPHHHILTIQEKEKPPGRLPHDMPVERRRGR